MIEPLKSLMERVHVRRREAFYIRKAAKDRARAAGFVLSFPKCGRTWHRVMVGAYLAQMTGESTAKAMDLKHLTRIAGLPRVSFSHNGTNLSGRLPASSPCIASPDLWQDRKVMLLVREPKAVLVSAYHHARYRSRTFAGSPSEFIRDPRWGIDKIATAYQRWHVNRERASEFIVTSYERMHARPKDVLRQTLMFMGVPLPDDGYLAEAVAFGRYDNMKSYENADFLNFRGMRKKRADDPGEGYKVREGKPDSYKSHLCADDIAYVDSRLAELGGNPFAAECAAV